MYTINSFDGFNRNPGCLSHAMECPQDSSTCNHIDEALRQSELRFRSTFENAAVGMAHVAPDGTWLRVNRRVCEIVGYTPDELLQRTFQDITHPDDLEIDLGFLRETIDGKRDNYQIEKRYFRKDGSIVWVNLTVGCVRSPTGKVESFISVIQDINEEKLIGRALEQSEERFRLTFENAAVGIAQVAPDGTWLQANRHVCELLGYSAEELKQTTFQKLTHPDDLDIGLNLMREMLQGKRDTMKIDKRYIRKDGSVVWANLTVACARNAAGDVDYMISVIEDITETKRMDQALSESEARLRGILQASPDGFIIFRSIRDAQGEIVDFLCEVANPAATKLSFMTEEEMVGHRMLARSPINKVVGLFDIYRDVVETGRTAQGEREIPLHDGSAAWFRFAAVKVGDGFAVSFANITERKQAEEDLRKSEARFRAVQQTSPDGFLICRSIRDESGTIRDFLIDYVNPAIEGYLGRPADEVMGGTMRRQMPVNFASGAFERYVQVVETGESWQGELIFPRGDGSGDGWYQVTVARVGDGVAVSYGDITDAKANEALLQARDQRLRTILNNVVAFIGLLSPEGILLEANDTALSAANLIRSDVIGKPFWETYWWSHNSDVQQELRDFIARAARGERVRQDMVIRTAGDNRAIIDIQLAPILDEFGNVIEIVPSGTDISDRKKAEQHREMLVRELSHRVKNSLATVQTIASHSLREATDLDSFREAFVGRLMAISKCHDLLIDTTRRDAHLADLVRDQVLPYARAGAQSQVTISGPNLILGAEAAHTFGLILHELATNAAKYGALSTEEGCLDISWKRAPDPTLHEAIVEWKESGGPPVSPPTRRGFGSVLIEQSLTYSLGGRVEINEADGVRAAILDMNIHGSTSFPIAERLAEKGTPFMFLSGNDTSRVLDQFSDRTVLTKPINYNQLLAELKAICES